MTSATSRDHWRVIYEINEWPILDDYGDTVGVEYAPGLWFALYRDELNRTRKAIKDMADHVNKFYFGGDLIDAEWVKDELYRIVDGEVVE